MIRRGKARALATALLTATGALALARCADILGMQAPFCDDGGCPDAAEDASGDAGGCASGFVCAPPVPAGWAGPVALVTSTDGGAPSCVSSYEGLVKEGHGGLHADAASCSCSCDAGTTTCSSPTIETWSSPCPNPTSAGAADIVGTSCTPVSDMQGIVTVVDAGTPTTPCTPGPVTTSAPSVAWDFDYAICDHTGPGGPACGAGACVEQPAGAGPCIYANLDVTTCPSAYPHKTSVMTGVVDDQRGCASCQCTSTGGACNPTISLYTGSTCGTLLGTISPGNCSSTTLVAYAKVTASGVTQGGCTGSSQATGAAKPTGPMTVCCAQ